MEILVHLPWWIWLLLSIIPFSIKRRRGSNMQSLVLSALLWQFSLTYQRRQYAWSFSLPWVRHVQHKLLASAWRKLIQEMAKRLLSFWR